MRGGKAPASSGLAGPLIMAASASLLGYWLYQRRTSGSEPAGRRVQAPERRRPHSGCRTSGAFRSAPADRTSRHPSQGQEKPQGSRKIVRKERRYAAFSDPEKAPTDQGSCYGAVRHAGPENMRDRGRRPWDKVDESADEVLPGKRPALVLTGKQLIAINGKDQAP